MSLLLLCFVAWLTTTAAVLLSPLWVSLIAAFGNGVAIAMLFIVGHDAAHYSLVQSHRMNRLIATLAFLPAFHPFSSWARSHNTKHHAWTNLKGEDPGFAPFSLEEYRELPPCRQCLERFYRTVIGLGVFYFVELYWKCMLFPSPDYRPTNRREFLFDRVIIGLFVVAQVVVAYSSALYVHPSFPYLFTAYAVVGPFAVFMWLMGFVTFQHHTNPEIPWFDEKHEWSFFQCQVSGTTHLQMPWFFEIVSLNILEHGAHHVDPLIPLYRLKASQAALERTYPGVIKVIPYSATVLWQTLARCKLYDYRQHYWLDFAGNRTTPQLTVPVREHEESPRTSLIHSP